MRIEVELRRVGMSRVSEDCIPLMARVFCGGKVGEDLLAKDELTDIECAKAVIQARLDRRFRNTVNICWIDATGARA